MQQSAVADLDFGFRCQRVGSFAFRFGGGLLKIDVPPAMCGACAMHGRASLLYSQVSIDSTVPPFSSSLLFIKFYRYKGLC